MTTTKKQTLAMLALIAGALAAKHTMTDPADAQTTIKENTAPRQLATGAVGRIEIEALPRPDLGGVPVARWVASGDASWSAGAPLFEVEQNEIKARGWAAVNDKHLRLKIVVNDAGHFNARDGAQIWNGDSIQIGVDALGDGPDPTAGNEGARVDDGAYIFALAKNRAQAWCQASGRSGATGARPDLAPTITRDDDAQTTTYEIALPWQEFRVVAGIAPTFGLSVQINGGEADAPAEARQARAFWGQGLDGAFEPQLFQRVALGDPSGDYAVGSVTKAGVGSADDAAEMVFALSRTRARKLAVLAGGRRRDLTIAADAAPGLSRYRARFFPGQLPQGSLPFEGVLSETPITIGVRASVAARAVAQVRDESNAQWFAFSAQSDNSPSVIGMESWLDAPAGKHGRLGFRGNAYRFANGTPIKFWGTNNSNRSCMPSKDEAVQKAAHYAKYGVNAVRLHKFTGSGWEGLGDPNDSLQFNAPDLDNFDFYNNELTKRGVYQGWSHIFMHKLRPADKARVLAYDEVVKKGSTYGLVNFARDLQDIQIGLTVNLLNHRNPYTGRRYADDPALSFIEMQNEDDIFFSATMTAVEASPTYKKHFSEMFSDWLQKKYGTQAALETSWGRGLNAYPEYQKEETLAARNIYPIAHDWWYSQVGFANQQANKGAGKRLLDTALFLYETQNDYYDRMAQAIRATGYKGVLIGSCWQAGDGISHYYNLHADFRQGIIDRHNYFGGQSADWRLGEGAVFDNSSMLHQPGSGYFSTGMQQVKNRPFALSEWIHVAPNQWSVEGPPIIAAYGMGLQGWDASYQFSSETTGFTQTIQSRGLWNSESPTQTGMYPILSRMVLRGDVREGAVVSSRKVSLSELRDGTLGFSETITQDGDRKNFGGDIPLEALAVGKVEVEFVDKPQPTRPVNIAAWTKGNVVVSNTGELRWNKARAGQEFFTINTAGTKAVVGFAPKGNYALGDVTIGFDNAFGAMMLTSLQPKRDIASAQSLLLAVMGRIRNTDMKFNATQTRLMEVGRAPILVEPMYGSVKLDKRRIAAVNILDHAGRRTGQTVPLDGNGFAVNGATHKTIYYEIVLR